MLNAFADDVALFIPGPNEIIPFVGQRQGREQAAQFFATLAEMQRGLHSAGSDQRNPIAPSHPLPVVKFKEIL
jgi:hypothetical protein